MIFCEYLRFQRDLHGNSCFYLNMNYRELFMNFFSRRTFDFKCRAEITEMKEINFCVFLRFQRDLHRNSCFYFNMNYRE